MQLLLTLALLLLLHGSVASERSASGMFGGADAHGLGAAASLLIGLASAAFASVFAILVRVAGASVRTRRTAVPSPRGADPGPGGGLVAALEVRSSGPASAPDGRA